MSISMTISTLNSYKPPQFPFKSHKFQNPFPQFTSSFPNSTTQSFNSRLSYDFPPKNFGHFLFSTRNYNYKNLGFCLNSQSGKAERGKSLEEMSDDEIRDSSENTLPERFKYSGWDLRLVLYPILALSLMVYSRNVIVWEVGNWRKWAPKVASYLTDCSKDVLFPVAVPLADLADLIQTTLYSITYFYKRIITSAPIGDLTLIIILASIILAIAETAVPDSMNSQPYIMTIAGLAGYAAVKGFITAKFFWAILMGLFIYSRLIKRKDYVSATLPAAAVLAAVGTPLARFVVMVSFSALAIGHHWKYPLEEKEGEVNYMGNGLPFPLVCAALAIGLRVAVNWVRYMYLTWKIV